MLNENHRRIIKEGFEAINWSIDKGIEDKQTTIGFHASLIAVNILELYLHEKNLIRVDYLLKHEWFKSKNKIKEKLNFDFDKKGEILNLLFKIEEKRNVLCYGKKQPIDTINNILESLYELKGLIETMGVKIEIS